MCRRQAVGSDYDPGNGDMVTDMRNVSVTQTCAGKVHTAKKASSVRCIYLNVPEKVGHT